MLSSDVPVERTPWLSEGTQIYIMRNPDKLNDMRN
jgi:hypothetical protein